MCLYGGKSKRQKKAENNEKVGLPWQSKYWGCGKSLRSEVSVFFDGVFFVKIGHWDCQRHYTTRLEWLNLRCSDLTTNGRSHFGPQRFMPTSECSNGKFRVNLFTKEIPVRHTQKQFSPSQWLRAGAVFNMIKNFLALGRNFFSVPSCHAQGGASFRLNQRHPLKVNVIANTMQSLVPKMTRAKMLLLNSWEVSFSDHYFMCRLRETASKVEWGPL